MPPKKRVGRPKKRTEPEIEAEEGSTARNVPRQAEPRQAESRQSTRLTDVERRELEELRAEKQRAFRAEPSREKAPISATVEPPAPQIAPRTITRKVIEEEGSAVRDFLRLNPPEFRGEEGDDPQEFLEETEKRLTMVSCSDAKAIEMIGLNMKSNAWEWYKAHIKDRLYGDNPPTWDEFTRLMLNEFLTPTERQRKMFQFEKLQQSPNMTVADYAKEFTRLSKYARHIVPTEAEKIVRFRAGLIPPLYKALLTANVTTLTQLVEIAKQWEEKDKEVRTAREERQRSTGRGYGGRGRAERTDTVQTAEQPNIPRPPPAQRGRGRKRRGQYRRAPVSQASVVSPTAVYSAGEGAASRTTQQTSICNNCGRQHRGPCKWGLNVCYRCGQPGHVRAECPTRFVQQSIPSVPIAGIPSEEVRGRGSADRGKTQMQIASQSAVPVQPAGPAGRGRGRVFTINPQDVQTSNTAVAGTLYVDKLKARVLFDSGATHSFISPLLFFFSTPNQELLG